MSRKCYFDESLNVNDVCKYCNHTRFAHQIGASWCCDKKDAKTGEFELPIMWDDNPCNCKSFRSNRKKSVSNE